MSNQKKLGKEILSNRIIVENKAIADMKPLLQAYKSSLTDIRAEVAKIYQDYTIDNELKIGKQQRLAVLKDLEKTLVSQAKGLGAKDVEVTTNILAESYKDAFLRNSYTLEKGINVTIDFALLRPEAVKAVVNMPLAGKMFSSRIWKNKTLLVNKVRQTVSRALVSGESVEKLSRNISKTFNSSYNDSLRLARTEVARCQSMASDEVYKNSGVVNKIMWDATLDSLTAPEDALLDGKMWGINETHPSPPLHPNCRCCLIPVVEGWTPTKKIENIKDENGNKKVIDYTTYDKWKESRLK